MKHLFFSAEHSTVSSHELKQLSSQLMQEIARIAAAWNHNYDTPYASLSLPGDTIMHQEVHALVAAKKSLHPTMLIVIGIGGSNLATVAVEQALHGILSETLRFFCADSVDPRFTETLYALAKQTLMAGNNIILVIISKSGTTTETIANAQLFTALLAQYKKNYQDYVVIISDEDSSLCKIAQKQGISYLQVPPQVGGRFSVFSPVGLFPLGMLGIDTKALLKGAASVQAMTRVFDNNPAAVSAAVLYALYKKGIVIHDSFFFLAQGEGIGRWYRQLLAESIGKSSVGIMPTISIGSVDLHSMAQLYLAGPHNRVTTFITAPTKSKITVPSGTIFDQLAPMIQGKKFDTLMTALADGIKKTYVHKKLPFMSIELPEISAYYIGQFMQLKMIEIMYLGSLFNINPFDQPQVELYKKETRKILAHD